MSEIYLTLIEDSVDAAIAAMHADDAAVLDGFEIRADALDPDRKGLDLERLRGSTTRKLVYTRRSPAGESAFDAGELTRALGAGFDLVDVELSDSIDRSWIDQHRDRVILSHHDRGMPRLDVLVRRMRSYGAARIKIVATPRVFADELAIVELMDRSSGGGDLSLFGMGRQSLFCRLLAPAVGSGMTFVARPGRPGAPGQLTIGELEGAGVLRGGRPRAVFAVVGSPVRHSRSPAIHNAIFAERDLDALYVMVEPVTLREVLDAMEAKVALAPLGISVTTPFKEEALVEAERRGWNIAADAAGAFAANTIARGASGMIVDNTDVDGFARLLSGRAAGETVAVVGAGATGRAAVVAARKLGLDVRLVNRDSENGRGRARDLAVPLTILGSSEVRASVVVNTLPAGAVDTHEATIHPEDLLIEASYSSGPSALAFRIESEGAAEVVTGTDLLEAQAVRQSTIFVEAYRRMTEGAGHEL